MKKKNLGFEIAKEIAKARMPDLGNAMASMSDEPTVHLPPGTYRIVDGQLWRVLDGVPPAMMNELLAERDHLRAELAADRAAVRALVDEWHVCKACNDPVPWGYVRNGLACDRSPALRALLERMRGW